MAENKLHFLDDFPAISTQEWMDKITADLKGADFNKKLVWRTTEGFNVMPFYRAENLEGLQTTASAPGEFPFVRGNKGDNSWMVRQDIRTSDAAAANAKAKELVRKGADSIGFKLDKKELSADYLSILLDGLDASKVELNFKVCLRKCAELASLLVSYFKGTGAGLSSLKLSIECDPLSKMLVKGKDLSDETITGIISETVRNAAGIPSMEVVGVNAECLANAGAYCSQELGYALAWGAQYMTWLTNAGFTADEAARRIKFNFGIGGNYFMEIAKFRAARLLWSKIVEAYGIGDKDSAKMAIHATTSTFNMTTFDAYVNLLRTQTEAMSAAIAGVDSMTVLPFDLSYKASDDFSERLARNQQLLLREEAHFDKVVDPSAGSYYIENLTSMLAGEAWKIFLSVDAAGGFFKAVVDGSVQDAMEAVSQKRKSDVATRREVYVGTNQFPNFTEKAEDKIETQACSCKCGCGDDEKTSIKTLPKDRAASEFEALRLETEKSGKTPKVFMLTIGNLAMRLARSQFSCNFFACAGYQVIDNIGFETVESGVEAAQKAGADVVVLCSSDDEYAQYAPEAFKAVAGRQLFVVAGAPACMEDLQKQGIDNFIHVKVNVLETLKSFNSKLLKK